MKKFLTFALFLCIVPNTHAQPTAVPTFECLGLYYPSNDTSECTIQYRPTKSKTWHQALPLVFDPRNNEHRGSIVNLTSNTVYEIRLTQNNKSEKFKSQTLNDQFPVGMTTQITSQSSTLEITESGTSKGYHIFTPPPKTRTTLDVGNQAENNITIDADYIIIRGFELKNAAIHSIRIAKGRHHIVIEDCRITFWGRIGGPKTFGNEGNYDSAISASRGAGHLIIQRNRIEDPRGGSNDWDTGHPAGPQAISLSNSSGNNIIRYNEIVTTDDHGFNDAIGGGSNYSFEGSPNRDSDIYGNLIAGVWDDAIESEGANMNVRIWGNHIERTFQHIATACTSKGPLYIFRNIFGSSRRTQKNPQGGSMIKTGQRNEFGGGRKYIFHNTGLQPNGAFHIFSGHPDPNTVTRNNIFDAPGRLASSREVDVDGDYDYDFYTGYDRGRAKEPHRLRGNMAYIPSHYLEYYPAPVTTKIQWGKIAVKQGGIERNITDPIMTVPNPVVNGGIPIPNFNEGFTGSAPDVGAFEIGLPSLRFGRRAYNNIWAPWELYANEQPTQD
ncbi:MAG: hypothetical protein HOH77_20270 [Candidatus Latescibacteria bacterium]|nr:hypothetical protein [Candidatus Latescibacterota bacterium]